MWADQNIIGQISDFGIKICCKSPWYLIYIYTQMKGEIDLPICENGIVLKSASNANYGWVSFVTQTDFALFRNPGYSNYTIKYKSQRMWVWCDFQSNFTLRDTSRSANFKLYAKKGCNKDHLLSTTDKHLRSVIPMTIYIVSHDSHCNL
jgi:hypothetical protein